MFLKIQSASLFWACSAFLSTLLCAYLIRLRYKPGVKSVPGPFFASFTNLWRLIDVHRGRADLTLRALHEKHGPLVRVGPNCISVADPAEIKTIYGITRLFPKVRLTLNALEKPLNF
jgi:hypothetical protein